MNIQEWWSKWLIRFTMMVLLLHGAMRAEEGRRAEGKSWHPDLSAKIEKYGSVLDEARLPLTELQASYDARLATLAEEVDASGDFQKAVLIRAERDGFRSGDLQEIGNDFPQMRVLQRLYRSEFRSRDALFQSRKRELQRLHENELRRYQTQLTQESRLEDARQVEVYLESMREVSQALAVELFWSTDFRGDSVKLEVPVEIPRFAFDTRVKNDQLRSIRIPKGVTVTLAQGADLTGESITLRRDTADIALSNISSLQAEE
ncbi:MAG: hypothetical protein AAF191_06100 [Verrucomicrobiota bacterium]